MIKPGKESTEHARAIRAEVLGAALALGGAGWAAVTSGWPAVVLCGLGVSLVAYTAGAYAHSRGNVKAAAVRRPADQAPRSI